MAVHRRRAFAPHARTSQRAAPAKARKRPARFFTPRSRPHQCGLRTDRRLRTHDRSREQFSIRVPAIGSAPHRRLPDAARTRLRRSLDVGEDRSQSAFERAEVHIRGFDRSAASRRRRRRFADRARHRRRHPAGGDAATVRAVPSHRVATPPHVRGIRHRLGAGRRVGSPARRNRLRDERGGRGHGNHRPRSLWDDASRPHARQSERCECDLHDRGCRIPRRGRCDARQRRRCIRRARTAGQAQGAHPPRRRQSRSPHLRHARHLGGPRRRRRGRWRRRSGRGPARDVRPRDQRRDDAADGRLCASRRVARRSAIARDARLASERACWRRSGGRGSRVRRRRLSGEAVLRERIARARDRANQRRASAAREVDLRSRGEGLVYRAGRRDDFRGIVSRDCRPASVYRLAARPGRGSVVRQRDVLQRHRLAARRVVAHGRGVGALHSSRRPATQSRARFDGRECKDAVRRRAADEAGRRRRWRLSLVRDARDAAVSRRRVSRLARRRHRRPGAKGSGGTQ